MFNIWMCIILRTCTYVHILEEQLVNLVVNRSWPPVDWLVKLRFLTSKLRNRTCIHGDSPNVPTPGKAHSETSCQLLSEMHIKRRNRIIRNPLKSKSWVIEIKKIHLNTSLFPMCKSLRRERWTKYDPCSQRAEEREGCIEITTHINSHRGCK